LQKFVTILRTLRRLALVFGHLSIELPRFLARSNEARDGNSAETRRKLRRNSSLCLCSPCSKHIHAFSLCLTKFSDQKQRKSIRITSITDKKYPAQKHGKEKKSAEILFGWHLGGFDNRRAACQRCKIPRLWQQGQPMGTIGTLKKKDFQRCQISWQETSGHNAKNPHGRETLKLISKEFYRNHVQS